MVEGDADKMLCPDHPKVKMDLYCKETRCKKMICSMCPLRGAHIGHNITHIFEIAEEIKTNPIQLEPGQFAEGAHIITQAIQQARQYYNDLLAGIQLLVQQKLTKLAEIEQNVANFFENNSEQRAKEIVELIDRSIDNFSYSQLFQIVKEKEVENNVLMTISNAEYQKSKIERKIERIRHSMTDINTLLGNHEELMDLSTNNAHLAYFATKQVRVYNVDTKLAKSIDVEISNGSPELLEENGKIYIVGDSSFTPHTYEVDIYTGSVQRKQMLNSRNMALY